MPQFGLLNNDEIQRLLDLYGTKASEKEINRRLGESAKQQSTQDLLAALIGKQQDNQQTPSQQPQSQTQQQPESGSFWKKLGTALMMGGAGLQGQDPSQVLKNLMMAQQGMQGKGVYQFNPYTGELEQVGTVAKGAEVRNVQVSPEEREAIRVGGSKEIAKYKTEIARESPERIQMASNVEAMDNLLNDMEQYLKDNPDVFIKGLNPLAEREFKAITDNYDKVAAIAAGGKQLTRTELNLIRRTRPGLLDTRNIKAIEYKFKILRGIQQRAKERLGRGVKAESKKQPNDEYQKYLNLIGGK